MKKHGMGMGPAALPPKNPGYVSKGGKYMGQLKGDGSSAQNFGDPMTEFSTEIVGMDSISKNGGEPTGFTTSGYINKENIPYGEAVKLNYMPPGMDISNQVNAEIHRMELKTLVDTSYPGDGWTPGPRDIPE